MRIAEAVRRLDNLVRRGAPPGDLGLPHRGEASSGRLLDGGPRAVESCEGDDVRPGERQSGEREHGAPRDPLRHARIAVPPPGLQVTTVAWPEANGRRETPRSTQAESSACVPARPASTRSQPAISRPRISITSRRRRLDERVGIRRIDVHQHPALAARGDGHVAPIRKASPPTSSAPSAPACRRPVHGCGGQLFVVRHPLIVRRSRLTSRGTRRTSRTATRGRRGARGRARW